MSRKYKKDLQLEYIIHYGFDFYSNVKEISESNEPRIQAAKLA